MEAFGKLREQQSRADKFKLKYTMRMMQAAYQGLLPIVAADPADAQVCPWLHHSDASILPVKGTISL